MFSIGLYLQRIVYDKTLYQNHKIIQKKICPQISIGTATLTKTGNIVAKLNIAATAIINCQ